VYLTYFYRLGYLYAKNYQIWWRFDEVLTKKVGSFLWHTLYIKPEKITLVRQQSSARLVFPVTTEQHPLDYSYWRVLFLLYDRLVL